MVKEGYAYMCSTCGAMGPTIFETQHRVDDCWETTVWMRERAFAAFYEIVQAWVFAVWARFHVAYPAFVDGECRVFKDAWKTGKWPECEL